MNKRKYLLKNGWIIDGDGGKPYRGSVLIESGKIGQVQTGEIEDSGIECIDCTGMAIAPGFIDSHSHMDWFVANRDPAFTSPFIAQGITTFVGGNCGYGIAGFRERTPFKGLIQNNLFKAGNTGGFWHTMREYFDEMERIGIVNNLITLAGHGTTRTSVRGFKPGPLDVDEMNEMLYLLEEAMDQGACGVSLGLQYEPGIFADLSELERVAELVKKKNKILTVHGRAYSAISGTYPLKPFGRAHNLLAIEEMLRIAERTGVRLQFSHLIFVGEKSWKSYDEAIALFNRAISKGIDVKTDCFASTCGASQINVVFPDWFLSRLPEAYDNRLALLRLRFEINMMTRLLGFGYDDIQIAHANHPELNRHNGKTIREIARLSGRSPFETLIDISKRSGGSARILAHRYMNDRLISDLLRYKNALFMTDAWYEPEGLQNPALYGGFPRILQMVRERELMPLEEAIHKMTGAVADRFNIRERGRLRESYAADITVFYPDRITDNTTMTETGRAPDGIEHVFINGRPVYFSGSIVTDELAGRCLRV
jgi:N-acyl-D-amino-acid deacylase